MSVDVSTNALEQAQARHRRIMDGVRSLALIVTDPDGRVTDWNAGAQRLLGWQAQEMIGQSLRRLFTPEDIRSGQSAIESENALAHGSFSGSKWLLRRSGERFRASVEITPLRNEAGGTVGFVHVLGDSAGPRESADEADSAREKRQAEQLAQANAARLQLALEVGEMGAWEWDVQADRFRWLEGAAPLHGLAPGEAPESFSLEDYGRYLHPEDHARVREVVGRMLADGRGRYVEYRTVWPDGSIHWLEARAEIFPDETGRPSLMSGVTVDVTRRKRTEWDLEFLARVSAELSRLVDPRDTLQKLAALAVPSFADWCSVDMLDEDGRLERVAVAHVDPQKVQLAQEATRRFPPDPAAPHGVWRVLNSGAADLIHEVTEETLRHAVRHPEYRALLREVGLKSYIGVPIVVQGRPVGVVTFIGAESGRLYEERDLALAEDVVRRASIAIENARLYQALQEADRRKDVFLATLAHELRNPLAAITSALGVIGLAPQDRPRVEEMARIVARQAGQLSRLVDDLTDISRITTGKIELRPEDTSLAAILHDAVETCRAQIEAGRHALRLSLPDGPTGLRADPVRLTQVFANLLGNAAKYTPPGGRIELALECTPAEYVVRVRDSGVGIPPDMLQNVFRIFVQIEHPLDRTQGGLGLGLALVEGWVALHGGRVEAHSEGVGRGSEFVVRLPRPPARAGDGPTRERDEVQMEEGKQDGGPLRILVVDDNVDAAQTLADLLGLLGQQVVGVVHDGLAAVSAAAELQPDVVLLDIGMPGLNGYEAARRIRAQEGEPRRMLVVALTGWGMEGDREQAFEAGFDQHWVKPVGVEQLTGLQARR